MGRPITRVTSDCMTPSAMLVCDVSQGYHPFCPNRMNVSSNVRSLSPFEETTHGRCPGIEMLGGTVTLPGGVDLQGMWRVTLTCSGELGTEGRARWCSGFS
ncbi:hypothetical protein LSAT2_003847 [Lamellibrachia satsuma]|nr:hypothetical protein LSAT2_003847 [Lamellibrachia satsuma]